VNAANDNFSGVRTYHGQRYTVADTCERERSNGTLATIIVWRSICANCGAPFAISTPARAATFKPNRRCQRHKRPGHRVRSVEE